ncbi:MAG: VCBS repeat-containing protein [Bacteroidota bacterium]
MGKEIRIISHILFIFLIAQSCTSPVEEVDQTAEKLFTKLDARQTGIRFSNDLVETAEENHLVSDKFITGSGVAIGDINNDGLPDIFFTGNQVADRLYLNKGNLQFEDITKKAGIQIDKSWSTGVTMADVNNDGFQDIYICKSVKDDPELSANLLYINNGDMTFSEQSKAYGLDDRGFSIQAVFFDYDKDGLLDMYLVNQPPGRGNRRGGKLEIFRHTSLLYTDKLFKNWGDRGFEDVSDYADIRNLAFGLSATVADFNGDSWPDIYVANDFDLPDHLYINQQNGKFKNTINQSMKHISNFSMGADVADYDNDGLLDIMTLDMVAEDHKRIKTYMGGMNPEAFWEVVNKGWHYQYMFNALQRNNGNGTFSEVAHIGGVSNTDWSWGPLFADFDLDGWKDLFVTNGVKRNMRHGDLEKTYSGILDSLENVAKQQGKDLNELIDLMELVEMAPVDYLPNYIYKNNTDFTFTKKTEAWGFDEPTLSNGASYADLDLDGDIDLIVNNINEKAGVYRNNAIDKQYGNYLKFIISNKNGSTAYGTTVTLYKDGKLWQHNQLTNVRGFMSKSEDVIHFGLGDTEQIEKLVITSPAGFVQTLTDVPANQLIEVNTEDLKERKETEPVSESKLFADITRASGITHKHTENRFNDYAREVLLPHRMSTFGPGLAVGDVNGDKLEDFYVGGAAGYSGALFLQMPSGQFEKSNAELWEQERHYEDVSAVMFDADNDNDVDLYIVSGGNEFMAGSKEYQDRLYLNDGKGKFSLSSNLPEINSSGACVVPADYDRDGDLDLFIGGRQWPGRYPHPADSYILENEGGKFKDVTDAIAGELRSLGMVTSAVWSDFNQDEDLDLVIVGEWMPVTFMENEDGQFRNVTPKLDLQNTAGWYFQIAAADFDQDGDEDYVLGNLGLNYKYKASPEQPFEVYSHDLDDNGTLDIVLSYYEHGKVFPVRGRSCSSQQVPDLANKFPTFESFGEADLLEVYGSELDKALHYQAKNFASVYLENKGDKGFDIKPLPNEAQFSSINNILAEDYNLDGHLDILISGNLYGAEIETPRNDAGMGLYLKGDGSGKFDPVPLTESGFFAPHDAKDAKMIRLGRNDKAILVANNNYYLQLIKYLPPNTEAENKELVSMK